MLLEEFISRAEAVGSECRMASCPRNAVEAVSSILLEEEVRDEPGHIALWAEDRLIGEEERQELSKRIPGVRFEATREAASQAAVGITWVDWGVAQTGTLVSNSAAAGHRLASMLPPVHVALLPADRIVDDMAGALARLDVRQCGYVGAITGPSRTADIERVLTIGVHGPRRLVIVLMEVSPAKGEDQ
jgi:L-lactate dehydrogenase complex protein LldG